MRQDEFLAEVRDRGEYADQEEALEVSVAVLGVLSRRIRPGEAKDLAAQLPGTLGEALETDGDRGAERFGVHEFCRRVADQTGARPRTAQWDAGAVLSTVASTVSHGEVNQVLGQLPTGYAALFGKADLSD
ncbi:DUF2267 domain-containing protein [Streptomyces sp. NHF165]|uniref:DUF2267 domain-containing protein n=1 Tax=Streptomyces TaxID=1883 RepID=UPI00132EAB29|nr:DUF2267 domain-containing protein [Streptomyces sp. NHF165]QHF95074.1 DUF2267 domain-containing protein [Streptomyces sp. NHF165]